MNGNMSDDFAEMFRDVINKFKGCGEKELAQWLNHLRISSFDSDDDLKTCELLLMVYVSGINKGLRMGADKMGGQVEKWRQERLEFEESRGLRL